MHPPHRASRRTSLPTSDQWLPFENANAGRPSGAAPCLPAQACRASIWISSGMTKAHQSLEFRVRISSLRSSMAVFSFEPCRPANNVQLVIVDVNRPKVRPRPWSACREAWRETPCGKSANHLLDIIGEARLPHPLRKGIMSQELGTSSKLRDTSDFPEAFAWGPI